MFPSMAILSFICKIKSLTGMWRSVRSSAKIRMVVHCCLACGIMLSTFIEHKEHLYISLEMSSASKESCKHTSPSGKTVFLVYVIHRLGHTFVKCSFFFLNMKLLLGVWHYGLIYMTKLLISWLHNTSKLERPVLRGNSCHPTTNNTAWSC